MPGAQGESYELDLDEENPNLPTKGRENIASRLPQNQCAKG